MILEIVSVVPILSLPAQANGISTSDFKNELVRQTQRSSSEALLKFTLWNAKPIPLG
jgi:hypothetical protein